MVALPLGLVAAGAAAGTKAISGASDGMAGVNNMSGSSAAPAAWLQALIGYGPKLLVLSIVLIVLAFAIQRSRWTVAAAVGGVILYAGMYVQQSLAVMYASIVVGFALFIVAAIGLRRRQARCNGSPST